MKRRPNKLDMLIYRVFRWRWNPILAENEELRSALGWHIKLWRSNPERVRLELESLMKRPRKDV